MPKIIFQKIGVRQEREKLSVKNFVHKIEFATLVVCTMPLVNTDLWAASLTLSATAPVPGANDVYNFFGASHDGQNVNNGTIYPDGLGNDAFTYMAGDRPDQGQTFTTGSNPNGYVVNAIWVRQVGYTNNTALTYGRMSSGSTWILRITDPADTGNLAFTVHVETYTTTGSEGLPNDLARSTNGAAYWLRFTFDQPVVLLPNKTYGFDLGSENLNAFFEWSGTSNNVFPGGSAYCGSSIGTSDNAMNPLVGDRTFLISLSPATASALAAAQQEALVRKRNKDQKFMDFDAANVDLRFDRASQTLVSFKPKGANGFDFLPADEISARAGNRFYYLGDLTFRLREGTSDEWNHFSTARARRPVTVLEPGDGALATADLTPTLPENCPLQITRTWALDDGKLVLRFDVKNKSASPVEIGSLGIPMIFNNLITDLKHNRPRTLEQAHEICSFSDPAICMDGGYIQVTRLNGHGPALVVVPEDKTPLEGYNPLLDDPTPRSQTFEGFYEWLAHTKAFAENEWKNARPWNAPTSETLAPGATRTFGVKFLVAPEIRDIEKTLAESKRPVAVGIPGYILPMGMDARLFLNYPTKVKAITVEPGGAISISKNSPTKNGWQAYTLRGKDWGRARLTITYVDGLVQTISYEVIKPESQALADLGHFLFTKQWFTNASDPFHRAPSLITYDREVNQPVTQERRVWIAGLSDEGGSTAWLAGAMKEFVEPDRSEIEKFQQFVDKVLWGRIQYDQGPLKYGVRKSLFYYDPKEFPHYYDKEIHYGGWESWNQADSERVDRAYNYPHVVVAYWTMYRLARNHPGLVTNHPWQWYLHQAYETTRFLSKRDANGRPLVGYVDMGLMEGDVFLKLLKDLQREGWTNQAAEIESQMKQRADVWKGRAYPFGSEMAWDSTGQEEVYGWCNYFGYADKAQVTLDSILGYMPAVPNWGYNGNARRYWDFDVAGKLRRIERQIHHYGSGLNAIPVLEDYREHPDDFHLLQIGYAGAMAALSNIDPDGFASQAFHAFPSTLKWDAYSSDYGPNLFGHAINTATYLVNHPEFGWIAFGGDVKTSGDTIRVRPLDSLRQRVYVAPLGLWLTLDAGTIESIEFNPKTHQLRIELSPADEYTHQARLRIEQPAKIPGVNAIKPIKRLAVERDAYVIPIANKNTWIELSDSIDNKNKLH